MPPEKALEARGWFEKAADDLRAAEILLAPSPPAPSAALFHAQQAAEKALKGFLVWHERVFRHTHDLRELAGPAIAIDPSLDPLLQRATDLNPFAVTLRYPGDAGEPTGEEALGWLALAREVVAALSQRLPEEARPPHGDPCS